MPDGTYNIPVDVIAENRTLYYAEVDGFERDSKEWDEEYKISLDPVEVVDWAKNNMDWSDVGPHAIHVVNKIDRDEYWVNGKMEVIEI